MGKKQERSTKSIFNHLCDQMERLADNEIDVDTAKAHAQLAKQANNLLKYELDRATSIAKYRGDLKIREIED